jgi:hypothetical protein
MRGEKDNGRRIPSWEGQGPPGPGVGRQGPTPALRATLSRGGDFLRM